MLKNKKIAIAYDWIDKWGGVERVLLTLASIFPYADFYTSYYDKTTASWAKNLKIKTSFIQKLPPFIKKNRLLSLPFYPFAFESFNFNSYDTVISITSSFAKGIITNHKTKNFCYLLTPTRYLWIFEKDYFSNKYLKNIISPYLKYLKKWDYLAAQRPEKIISISKTVAKRCQKYYQRKSLVIYPPFDINYWNKINTNIENQKTKIVRKLKIKNLKFFLVVSRLEIYKKVDLVIKTFNNLKDNLIIVGKGTQEKYLKKLIKTNRIKIINNLTDEELGFLYKNAQGLIIPQEEDFGYISLEAQFFNCPIIAYKKGGATETVLENRTGIFFNQQIEKELENTIERYRKIEYNLKTNLIKNKIDYLKKFNLEVFKKKFLELIEK